MTDNICHKCGKKFKSQYHLTRHNNNKIQCSSPIIGTELLENICTDNNESNKISGYENDKIINLFKQIIKVKSVSKETLSLFSALIEDEMQLKIEEDLVNKSMFKCIDCNQEFAHRQGLYKHNKLNRCRIKKDGFSLQDILDSQATGLLVNNLNPEVNIHDIENSNVNVDASVKNNITNNFNYSFNVQPFGLESLEHITLKDFKYIFSDSSKLMNKLCEYVFLQNKSNMSFYKHNLNQKIISFLSKNMEIKRINEKDFIVQFTRLLEDTCILLFYQHKEQLTEQELIKYMKRLVEYQDTILCERSNGIYQTDTKNCILNLMDTAFRNKDIKYNIEKIIKDLNENLSTKNDIMEELNDEDYKRDDIINEFYNKKTSTTHKILMDKTPANKILHKIRAKAMEINKEEEKVSRQRAIENSLKNVNFSTNENDS